MRPSYICYKNSYTDKTIFLYWDGPQDPFYYHSLPLILVWISNYLSNKVWDEITYPFPNFNSEQVKVLNFDNG